MTRTFCIAAGRVRLAILAAVLASVPLAWASGLEEDLRAAALADNLPRVRRLLRRGADINAVSEAGVTPLTSAAVRGSRELIGVLLAAKRKAAPEDAEDAGRAVLVALAYQNRSAAAALAEGGASMQTRTAKGQTALLVAGAQRDARLARLFLERGADANARDKSGKSALMIFAADGNVEGVKILLRGGAMRELKAKDGATALGLAKRRGHAAVVEVLEGPPVGMGSGVD